MKLIWSTLHVSDLERSLAFYQDILELPVTRRMDAGPHGQIAFLSAGDVEIELIRQTDAPVPISGDSISWGFAVASLESFMEKLKVHGIPVLKGPIQPSPFVRFLFIQDPDGMTIQIVEQLAS